jgi:ribosomal protein S18 acetylase RimI-like enzyme
MADVRIDPATLADCRAVAQIHVDAWRAAYAGILSDEFLAALSVDQRETMWHDAVRRGSPAVLVARVAGHITGWVAFGSSRDEGAPADRGEVWAIYVAPPAWSLGVGRSLLAAAIQALAQGGYREASLWVMRDNARALRFYRQAGLTEEAGSGKYFELGGHRLEEVRYFTPLPCETRGA